MIKKNSYLDLQGTVANIAINHINNGSCKFICKFSLPNDYN